MTSKKVYFVCGNDDFLVNRKAQAIIQDCQRELSPEALIEIVEGSVNNVSEVEAAVRKFKEATQMLSLFGEKKLVWLRKVSFMGEGATSRAEGTREALNDLQALLEQASSNDIWILITASPIDRRLQHFKSFEKVTNTTFIEESKSSATADLLICEECKEWGVSITNDASKALIAKVNGNSRMLVQEIQKLATYLGVPGSVINEQLVIEHVQQYGEGDFFEIAEAFFSFNLKWTLEAIDRYFYTNSDARAVITSLQNRNRLLIQLKTLIDAKAIKVTPSGIDKKSFELAASEFSQGSGVKDAKSSYSVFTQNLWYLGRLAQSAQKTTLKKLIDFQQAFIKAFERILEQPNKQSVVIQELALECLV